MRDEVKAKCVACTRVRAHESAEVRVCGRVIERKNERREEGKGKCDAYRDV